MPLFYFLLWYQFDMQLLWHWLEFVAISVHMELYLFLILLNIVVLVFIS